MSREITSRIIEMAEDTRDYGVWEAIARECLSYMSEDDVADMNRVAEFVPTHTEDAYEDGSDDYSVGVPLDDN